MTSRLILNLRSLQERRISDIGQVSSQTSRFPTWIADVVDTLGAGTVRDDSEYSEVEGARDIATFTSNVSPVHSYVWMTQT